MNRSTRAIAERFQLSLEDAVRLQVHMEIDFSESTEREFDAEALRVYQLLFAEEQKVKAVSL